MKKHINIIGGVILMWLMFGFTSCTSYLDRTPDSVVSSTDAFINFTNFQGYVEQLYALVPDYTAADWGDPWFMADETIDQAGNVDTGDHFDQGDYRSWQGWVTSWLNGHGSVSTGGWQNGGGLWPNGWYAIRKANLGLENLDKLTDATQEQKNFIKGQLLFFRAWNYFELATYWGGLPYITHALSSSEKMEYPRLTFQQTADSIAQDFRAAADLLPVDWDKTATGANTIGNNTLRINKMMCLAYLGKDYLYAGSPLMNKESTGSATYNKGYCQKAAAAFAEMLKYIDDGESWLHLVPFSQYSSLFWSNGSSQMPGYQEDVFTYPVYSAGFDACPWGPAAIFVPTTVGSGQVSANANFVDNYGMANGLPITDPNSGYDPKNPWANRDPRFYDDIGIDGDQVIYGTAPANKEQYRYIALYTGGSGRNDYGVSRTGYFIKKFTPMTWNNIDNGWNSWWNGQNYMHLAYMRLPDVYLMYAEAVLQGYGSATSTAPGYSLTAEQAVDKIRTRAGVGPVGSAYVSDPQKFMSEIIRERAVEFSFEEAIRFNDLRRWMLMDQHLDKTAIDFDRGTVVVPASEIPSPGIHYEPVNMRKRVILTRVFHDFNYWLPLPTTDTYLYASFPQNPGY